MAVSKANMLEALGWNNDLQNAANEKKFVIKEEGKQLSSNDFSDADKAKLDSLKGIEPATATKLGGIKVGEGLDIQNDGTLSLDYDLPTASTTKKGGIKVGTGLSMDGETLNADEYDLPTASKTRKGGIKVGEGLDMTGDTLSCTVEPGITNLVSQTQNGIMRATDKVKLDGIEDNAQVNTIERIKVDNSTLAITNKTVNIDLSGFVKSTDIAGAYHYKGTVNSYANLPTSGQIAGDVYNVRTAGGQDINGDEIKAGDNVAWTGVGWDVLAGTIDLSNFVEKVPDKDLSTEDFTTALKNKLEGLSNYSLPTASTTTKGGVKIGTGLKMSGETLNATATSYTLPTASDTQKGGVVIGAGLSMSGDTLNVTMTSGTNIIAGIGLSFAGDTLNCTFSSGGGTYDDFTGATSVAGGTNGLVPSPAAGDNAKFLRGDGTWAPLNQNVTIVTGTGNVPLPYDPRDTDGALWADTLNNGDPVLKMRYGDYEFNFKYDTSNQVGTTPPPITPENAQLYMLDTVPSTDEGTLWYNVTQSTYFPIPALCLHAGSYDYGYNYDTITYKGAKKDLVAYLPLQGTVSDAMGNSVTSEATPVFGTFTVNGATYTGLRNIDSSTTSSSQPAVPKKPCVIKFSAALPVFTVDCWLTVLSSNSVNATQLLMMDYGSANYSVTYTASSKGLNVTGGTPGLKGLTGRHHVALTVDSSGKKLWVDGKLVSTNSTATNGGMINLRLHAKPWGTGASGAQAYLDHVRVWNKVVWDGDFEVPKLSDY